MVGERFTSTFDAAKGFGEVLTVLHLGETPVTNPGDFEQLKTLVMSTYIDWLEADLRARPQPGSRREPRSPVRTRRT